MFMIRTSLAKSRIKGAGLGVFTEEPVKKGQLVWQWHNKIDVELSFSEVAKMPAAARHNIYKYLWLRDPRKRKLTLCADLGAFVNHSDTPNLSDGGKGGGSSEYATRDIPAGTELTCDYNSFDDAALIGVPTKGKPRTPSPHYDFVPVIEEMARKLKNRKKSG